MGRRGLGGLALAATLLLGFAGGAQAGTLTIQYSISNSFNWGTLGVRLPASSLTTFVPGDGFIATLTLYGDRDRLTSYGQPVPLSGDFGFRLLSPIPVRMHTQTRYGHPHFIWGRGPHSVATGSQFSRVGPKVISFGVYTAVLRTGSLSFPAGAFINFVPDGAYYRYRMYFANAQEISRTFVPEPSRSALLLPTGFAGALLAFALHRRASGRRAG